MKNTSSRSQARRLRVAGRRTEVPARGVAAASQDRADQSEVKHRGQNLSVCLDVDASSVSAAPFAVPVIGRKKDGKVSQRSAASFQSACFSRLSSLRSGVSLLSSPSGYVRMSIASRLPKVLHGAVDSVFG